MGDYTAMLEHSYETERAYRECPPHSRLAFLSEAIFDFTTYDGAMDEFFATKAIEVCKAITERKTFEYIERSEDHYRWYLAMVNMPFFADRLLWGTSIRGAWWDTPPSEKYHELRSCSLWKAEQQILELRFSNDEWEKFIGDVIAFGSVEFAPAPSTEG